MPEVTLAPEIPETPPPDRKVELEPPPAQTPSQLAGAALGQDPQAIEMSLRRHRDFNTALGVDGSTLQWSLNTAYGVNSELAARVQYLSNKTGMPPPDPAQISRNATEYAKWTQASKLYDHITQKDAKGQLLFPALHKHMSDPNRAAVLKDDVDALARLEAMTTYDYGGALARNAWRGKEGLKALPAKLATALESMTTQGRKTAEAKQGEAEKLLKGLSLTPDDEGELSAKTRTERSLLLMESSDAARTAKVTGYAARAAKVFADFMPKANPLPTMERPTTGLLDAADQKLEQLAGDISENAPQLAATMAAALLTRGAALRAGASTASATTAGKLAGAGFMGAYIYGSDVQELRDKVGEDIAHKAALRDALVQGALESLPLGVLFRRLGANSGRQALIRSMVEVGVAESGTEFLQQFPQDWFMKWAEEEAKGGTTGEVFDRTWGRVDLAETAKEGLWAGLVVLPLSMVLGAGAMAHSYNKGKQSEQTVEALKQMAQIADETKVKGAMPAYLESFVKTGLEHAGPEGVKAVQIAPAALEQLYQGDEAGLKEALQKLGIEEAYNQAKQADTEVEVAPEKLVTVLNAEQVGQLGEDIRPHPELNTLREIKEINAQKADMIESARAQIQKDGARVLPQRLQAWREKFLTKGEIQGRKVTAEEVDAEIAVAWAGAKIAAKRWGVTEEEWVNSRYGELDPAAEVGGAAPAMGQLIDQTNTPEFQAWSGGAKVLTRDKASPPTRLDRDTRLSMELNIKETQEAVNYYQGELDRIKALPRPSDEVGAKQHRAGLAEAMRNLEKAQAQLDIQQTTLRGGKHEFKTGEAVVIPALHGTASNFQSFEKEKLGATTGAKSAKKAFFSVVSPTVAGNYATLAAMEKSGHISMNEPGQNIMPLWVKFQNPLVVNHDWEEKAFNKFIDKAIAEGHDGVIFTNSNDDPSGRGERSTVLAALSPTQMKSSIGNSGAFDPNNPSILFQDDIHARVARALDRTLGLENTVDGLGMNAAAFFQLREAPAWAEKFLKDPELVALFGQKNLERFGKDMLRTAAIYSHLGITPEEVKGNPLRNNMDPLFSLTFDLSTMCPQQDQYVAAIRALESAYNGVFPPEVRAQVGQLMKEVGEATACWYCYGQASRDLFDYSISRGVQTFNRAVMLSRESGGEALTEAQILDAFGVTGGNLSTTGKVREVVDKYAATSQPLDALRIRDVIEGAKPANEAEAEIARAIRTFAQGASGMNKVKPFSGYFNSLLKLTPQAVAYFNSVGGIRMNSQTDFRAWHVVDMSQFLTHAAKRKLGAHVYAKEPWFVKIFGKTGIKFNMSMEAVTTNGKVDFDYMEGFPPEEALRLRKANKNCGIMLMAADDAQFKWGLDNPEVDMMIPFHAGRLNKAVVQAKAAKDYSNWQHEDWIGHAAGMDKKAVTVAGGVYTIKMKDGSKVTISPPPKSPNKGAALADGHPIITQKAHQNNKARYFEICKKLGVKPKWEGLVLEDGTVVTEHKNYMKLVRDIAATKSEQTPVDPTKTDWDAAGQFLAEWEKAGGDQVQARPGLVEYLRLKMNELKVLDREIPEQVQTKAVQETVDPFTDLAKIKSQPWAGTIVQDKDNGVMYGRGDLVAALVRRRTNLEALLNCVRG